MRNMKDSGIEWIGKIPNNWRIQRGKNIITKLEKPVFENDQVITCFRDGEVTLRSNRREDGYTVSLQETGYQGIDKGDLVVHGMDGFAGAIGISDSRGKATPVLNVLDSNENKKYLMYFMRSAAYCGLFFSLSTGIRIRTCDTNWNKLKNISYLVPSISEQSLISDYIEQKCFLIDNIIEKTKSSIEEYRKLKQAIVTQAVTKGVRSNRPMKDSGNIWFGSIPSEWSAKRIKYIFRIKKDIAGQEGFTVLSITQKGIKPKNLFKNEGQIAESYANYQIVNVGDFAMNHMDLLTGWVDISPYDGVTSPDYRVFVLEDLNCNRNYYLYLMQMCYTNRIFYGLGQGVSGLGRWRLQADKFLNFVVPVPSLEEQYEIAVYLDSKCLELDKLIVKKELLISDLELYKKSIIYEYVTGKKEVPST